MVSCLFGGDVVMPDNPGYKAVDEEIRTVLNNYQYKICNFEAPIKTNAKAMYKAGPTISQSPETVKFIKELGFNVVTLANNHIMDYGHKGLLETMDCLKKTEIGYIGAGFSIEEAYHPFTISDSDDVKVAIINAAEHSFGTYNQYRNCGHAWIFDPMIKDSIIALKQNGYYVVLVAHAGAEGIHYPFPEWRNVYRLFLDIGVDVVVAHHPHVLQGIEHYKNGIIFYSLGNFLWQEFSDNLDEYETMLVGLSFYEGHIEYKIYPCVSHAGRLVLSEEDTNINEYSQLLLLDDDTYSAMVDDYCEALFNRKYVRFVYASSGLLKPIGIRQYFYNLFLSVRNQIKPVKKYIFLNTAVETNAMIFKRAAVKGMDNKEKK